MNTPITLIQISDLHLGHRRTPTQHIIENLNRALPNNASLAEIDLLVITGDVFDTLLQLPDTQVFSIRLWMNRLLRLCRKYDIVLRILEGTPSHDWKQSRLFTHMNELIDLGTDVRYVDALSIETIDRFGLTILYCPDEWKPTCDDIWVDVCALLESHGLKQVDLALMHGTFEHQLPPRATMNTHKIDRYCSIVRYLVCVGHIHIHSVRQCIVCPGSFDRLAHGEEAPKGYIKATLYPSGDYTATFIENKDAACYKTLDFRGHSPEAFFIHAQTELELLPQDAHVRFLIDRNDGMRLKLDRLKEQYPFMDITRKVDAPQSTASSEGLTLETQQPSLVLTTATLPTLLLERLHHIELTNDARHRAEALLNDVLSNTRSRA